MNILCYKLELLNDKLAWIYVILLIFKDDPIYIIVKKLEENDEHIDIDAIFALCLNFESTLNT